jgi:hypothetical protein
MVEGAVNGDCGKPARLQAMASLFWAACDEGDLVEAKRLIAGWGEDRADLLSLVDGDGSQARSIVIDAIRTGRMSLLRFMVEVGANIEAMCLSGPPAVLRCDGG